VGAWEYASENIVEHPIIGHGPYYSIEGGLVARYWPHNVYLYYASIVGILGLGFYLWLLWEMLRASRPRAASLGSGTYIEGATLAVRVMLIVFMVDQIKIDYLRNERYSFFVWFLFGLVTAVSHVARREAAAKQLGTTTVVAGRLDHERPIRRDAGGGLRGRVAGRPAVPNQGVN
jgi:O-antigen ligase